MKKEEIKVYPHLYPKPIVLVGALVEGKPNFFTVGDIMTSGYQIPRIIISSGKRHHTNKGIISNETFSVNIPSSSQLQETDYCGIVSGKKKDKSKLFDVFYGKKIKTAPLIKDFPLNHACKLVKTIDFGDTHYLFIGEITESYVKNGCLINDIVNVERIDPVSICTIDNYYRCLGKVIGKAYELGRSLTTN